MDLLTSNHRGGQKRQRGRRQEAADPQHLGKTAEAASEAAQAAAWRLLQAQALIEACGLGSTAGAGGRGRESRGYPPSPPVGGGPSRG